jgi:hypothetical protein
MIARLGLIHDGSVVQNGPGIPMNPSARFTTPTEPLKSTRIRIPIATGGVMSGR